MVKSKLLWILFFPFHMPTLEKDNEQLKKELRAALARAEAAERKAAKAESRATKAESRATKAESRAEQMATKVKRLEDLLIEQKKIRIAQAHYFVNGCRVVAKLLIPFKDKIPGFPCVETDQIVWLVKRAEADMHDLPEPVTSKLLKYMLSKGNESAQHGLHKPIAESSKPASDLQKELKESQKELAADEKNFGAAMVKMAKSLNDKRNQTSQLIGTLGNLVKQLDDETKDSPLIKAANQIMQAKTPKSPKEKIAQPKMSLGRQVPKAKTDGELCELSVPEEMHCNHCGIFTKLKPVAMKRDFTRHLARALEESLEQGHYERPVLLCPECGHVNLPDDGKFPIPYSPAPGCQFSSDLVCQTGMLVTTGMPTNRVISTQGLGDADSQISTAELNRAVTRFALENGPLALLAKAHEKAVAFEKIILCDETPFEVLDQRLQRNGACAQQAYLQVLAAAPNAGTQFAIFKRMESRSAKELKRNLADFHFDVLVTDGYPGYVTLQAQDHFTLQNCLVHWRRTMIECIDFPEIEKLAKTEEGCRSIRRQLSEGAPAYSLCFVMEALCKLFALEASLKRGAEEAYDGEYLKRVRTARTTDAAALMDDIDTIMRELAPKHVVGENGKYRALSKADPFAGPFVYYMNAREHLRAFLSDPRICMDTNSAERAIRAVTLYRHSAFFKQTREGTESYCNYMTLRETAVMNGIAHPTKWVRKFSRAFLLHCLEYDLTERAKSAKINETTPLRTGIHKFSEQAIQSFDFTPWLAWNYAKGLKPCDRIPALR